MKTSIILLLLLLSTNSFAKDDSAEQIQNQWLQGLLIGKDMKESSFPAPTSVWKAASLDNILSSRPSDSLSLTNQVDGSGRFDQTTSTYDFKDSSFPASKKPSPKRNDYYADFKVQSASYLHDLNRVAANKNQPDQHQQQYLERKRQTLKAIHDKLIDKLESQKQQLIKHGVAHEKIQKLDFLINQQQQQWVTFTEFDPLKFQANKTAQTKQTDQQKSPRFILRNSNLPFGARRYSSEPLVYEPQITPSYQDQNALEPIAVDLLSSLVSQVSQDILELANTLDHDYIKIYNFVRQNIQSQYYSGAMKGASATLTSYAGNDVDQAALLIALLRASNVPARFVHGVIEQPVEEVMKAIGLSEASDVLLALDRAGISSQPWIHGGSVTRVQTTH
ncbi:MAG: hypothetical protein L3J79_04535, partial [Candidatus Marinimicrobia bacterium]|nr:hypothetical protein [Candidatus Neomarinimicrobiota bacterium]